ncbi:MAG: DUF2383 domain-containing protein [Bacteroidota bacterium]
MQKNEKLIGVLNDLIRINNDRFEGYKNLLTSQVQLGKEQRLLVYNMADQSRAFTSDLITEVIKLRTAENSGASLSAGIYRQSMSFSSSFSGVTQNEILLACQHLEEAIQKAYYDAICMAIEVPDRILNLVNDQKREMKVASSMIKDSMDLKHAVAA